MKKIQLGNKKIFAIVDDRDYDRLVDFYNWYQDGRGYVHGRKRGIGASFSGFIKMHSLIMGTVGMGRSVQVDHVNGNKLDNRRENLRVCSASQNQWNAKIKKTNTSGYRGVTTDGRGKKNPWKATIRIGNGKILQLGKFKTPELAGRAYDEAAKKYHGEYARLNFPDKQED